MLTPLSKKPKHKTFLTTSRSIKPHTLEKSNVLYRKKKKGQFDGKTIRRPQFIQIDIFAAEHSRKGVKDAPKLENN